MENDSYNIREECYRAPNGDPNLSSERQPWDHSEDLLTFNRTHLVRNSRELVTDGCLNAQGAHDSWNNSLERILATSEWWRLC